MIIKKPYAFLIKHFRVIHLILSVLLLFLVTKTNAIFKFFNDYAKNGYYAYSDNLSTRYINFYMFIAIVVVLVIASFIYLLMRWKKKSRVLYIAICMFYFLVFIGFLVYFNVFYTILNTTMDIRTVRIYRDISAIMYFPQYLFLVFAIIRAIGFDIKKFDFKKDLEELDIAEEDQEEIEVTFGQNSYKYKRKARRIFREIKYYALENKFFFAFICGTATLILVFFVYVNVSVYNKKYSETQFFNVNGVVFRVLNSFVSDVDLNGHVIKEDYKYVVVSVSMDNTNRGKVSLSTNDLALLVEDKNYYPTYTKIDYFKDFGEMYYKNTLYPGEKYEYLFIYEIPVKAKTDKVVFRLMDNVSLIKGEISPKYKDVTLKVQDYVKKKDTSYYNVGAAISLEESTLKNSELLINSSMLGEQFEEIYNYCVKDKCYDGKKIIKADTLGKDLRTILKLNIEVDIDSSLYISKFLDSNSNFVSMFCELKYDVDGKEKKANISVKQLENVDTKNVYLEVPSEIKRASEAWLEVTVRNVKYIINLNI